MLTIRDGDWGALLLECKRLRTRISELECQVSLAKSDWEENPKLENHPWVDKYKAGGEYWATKVVCDVCEGAGYTNSVRCSKCKGESFVQASNEEDIPNVHWFWGVG